jgi:predicted nucleic acid-binding Zn ribbon protein
MPTDRVGDNPVDGFDNGSDTHPRTPDADSNGIPEPGSAPDRQDVHSHGEMSRTIDQPGKGADLARAALRAAQATAAARWARSGARSRYRASSPVADAAARPSRRTGGRSARRGGYSAAGPDDRDPQPLGRAVARLVTDRRWTDRLTSGSLFARWPELVGPEVAAHVRPETLRDGELTVRTDTTAWATQLRLLQRQLLGRIADGIGPGLVRRLRVLAPDAPSWRHGPRTVRGRGPRDTYG